MKQFLLQVIALLIVIFGGLWVSTNPTALNSLLSSTKSVNTTPVQPNSQKTITIISLNGQPKVALKVEIADTDPKRSLGLGARASLEQNSGMLFLFDTPKIPQFWMKGMKFGLDIIWINGDTIVGITENVPSPTGTPAEVLPTLSPTTLVDKVLEVNTGFAKAHRITTGDKLKQI